MFYQSTSPHWAKISGVKSYIIPGEEKGPCVILFHGYGADAEDLAPLAQELGLPKNVTWIFPNGCQEVLIGPGMTGRAWFQIDVAAMEEAMRAGTHRDMSQVRPPGLDEAKAFAHGLLNTLRSQHNKLIWGGFSQGAMLSTELALSEEVKPDALVLLSGGLLDESNWSKLALSCKGIPTFQSHGDRDPLLAFSQAENLFYLLKKAGLKIEFHSFSGGHEIPMSVLQLLSHFLKAAV